MDQDEMTTAPRPAKRTAAKKAANVRKFEFKTKKKTFPLEAFGRVWTLKQPNQVVTSDFIEGDDVGKLITYIVAHVVKDERNDFLKVLAEDEDFDLEHAIELSTALAEVVYSDIPTPPS